MIFDTIDVQYLKEQLDNMSYLDRLEGLRYTYDTTQIGLIETLLYQYGDTVVKVIETLFDTTSHKSVIDTLQTAGNTISELLYDDDSSQSVADILAKLSFSTPDSINWLNVNLRTDETNFAGLIDNATFDGNTKKSLATVVDLVRAVRTGANYYYTETPITVTTTESSTDLDPNPKFTVISNRGSNDIKIRLNDGTAPQILIPAGTAKVIMKEIDVIYHQSVGGDSTLVINGLA